MKQLLSIALVSLLASVSFAKKNCTEEPKEKWMTEEAFKTKVQEMGYKIKKFKQPGSCYEIYGWNKEGKKVEVYFDPTNMKIIKEEID